VPAPARPEPAPLPPTLRQAVVPKPPAEDPDLTALAAAVFGPRAHTPSHPRAPRGPQERG
jgi:hypothetical protein